VPTNDFLVWAGGLNANVLSQSNYSTLGNLASGVVAGRASGQQANKTWRQSTIMSAMIAKFIVDRTGQDVIDDGSIQVIENNFIQAIGSFFGISNTGVTPGTYGPTMALTVQADGRITSLANANLQGTGLTPGTYIAPTITVGPDGRITGVVSVAYGPLASPNTWAGANTFAAGLTSTALDNSGNGGQFRFTQGSYGALLRNDGTSAFLLSTNSGQQSGAFNALRPFAWNLASGAVTIDGTGAGTVHGGSLRVPNNANWLSVDSGGTARTMMVYTSDNWVQMLCGQSGWRVLSQAGATTGLTVLNTGDVTANHNATVSGNLTVNGFTSTTGVTYFGSNGLFYAQPGANPQIVLGGGNALSSDGSSELILTSPDTILLSAPGTVTVNSPTIGATGNISAAGALFALIGQQTTNANPTIATLASDFIFTNSFAEFPHGMIVQWGRVNVPGDSLIYHFSYPIEWPNQCMALVICYGSALNPPTGSIGIEPFDRLTFAVRNTAIGGINGCWFIAIGN